MAVYDVDTDGGGTYLTLAAAIAALDAAPSQADTITLTGNTVDTAQAIISAVASDRSTYPLTITGENRTGVWDDSLYTISGEYSNGGIIDVDNQNVTVDAVQIDQTYTGTNTNQYGYASYDINNVLKNSIIRGAGGSATGIANPSEPSTDCRAWNCVIYGFSNTGGKGIGNSNPRYGNANEYSNITIYDCYYGVFANASYKDLPIFINCVIVNCTDAWANTSDTTTSSNNASYDTVGNPSASGGVNLTSNTATDYFVSATDFHIEGAATYASELVGAGATLTDFTDDIDGDTRTVPWDIGADESTLATIYAGYINPTTNLYEPTVDAGAINTDFIASTAAYYEPVVSITTHIDAGFIASTAALYEPGAYTKEPANAWHNANWYRVYTHRQPWYGAIDSSLDAGFIPSTLSLYAPTLNLVGAAITAGYIASTTELFEPTIGAAGKVTVPHIASTNVLSEPTLNLETSFLSAGFISATTVLYDVGVSNFPNSDLNIDGSPTLTIATNYQSKTLYCSSTNGYFTID